MSDMNIDQASESTQIDIWEEIVGKVQHMERRAGYLVVELNTGRIEVPVDSRGANHLQEKLQGTTGKVVSILRTDHVETPFVVLQGNHRMERSREGRRS